MRYSINLIWDHDAHVWVATSNTIPGLVLEHESLDELFNQIRAAISELTVMN